MKQWKTIVVTIVVLLWIATVIVLVKRPWGDVAPEVDNVKLAQARIAELKVVLEEQRLITEIITLRYDAAVIQSKLQPAPQPAPAPKTE